MKKYTWKTSEMSQCSYYYNEQNGRIVGQINKLGHTSVWLAKIIKTSNEENFLGQYIEDIYAKKAIENFWEIDEKTLLEHSYLQDKKYSTNK
jgi:hypothetical protein